MGKLRLTQVMPLGRYENTETGKQYNIKKGKCWSRGYDWIYYTYRGKRVIIPVNEFYSDKYKKVENYGYGTI